MQNISYSDLVKKYYVKGFKSSEITAAIGKDTGIWRSIRTTQYYLKKLNLQKKGVEDNQDLIRHAVQEELDEYSRNLGVTQIWKNIRRKHGLLVKRSTVREIIKYLEPDRSLKMKKGRLHRRTYRVNGPNYIWHVDGNDKLKPYGFCISGAIDGWSRKVLWLEVDVTNKNSNLICKYFLSAIKEHSIVPKIVRMDRGTENVAIADCQSLFRSSHNDNLVGSCVMFGSSNHNQRIERWWGYCRRALLQSYMDLFKDLELSGIVDMSNVIHQQCLKFCFMGVLRKELAIHANIWNQHRIRRMKQSYCQSGVPNFLFCYPEYFDAIEQGIHVEMHEVDMCNVIYPYQRNMLGSEDAFSEWALEVMLEKQMFLPDTFKEAYILFSELILLIHASDV